jgi:hypothetical protein
MAANGVKKVMSEKIRLAELGCERRRVSISLLITP